MTNVRDTNYPHLVKKDKLPTAEELRRAERLRIKQELAEGRERRIRARELLFGKGNGRMKNLSLAEQKFIQSVKRASYTIYVHEKAIGKRIRPEFRPMVPTYRVLKYIEWMKLWWCRSKGIYKKFDVPRNMKAKMEEMRSADRDSAL